MKLKIYSTDSRVDSFDVYANGVFKANVPITYPISTTVTNGSSSGDTSISKGGTAYVTLSAGTGYNLPSSITVTGATYTYDSSTGVVSLSAPTGDVSIAAECASSGYNVRVQGSVPGTESYVAFYDGQDAFAPRLFWSDSGNFDETIRCTSGYLTSYVDLRGEGTFGTASGGVSVDTTGDPYRVYTVTADGSITGIISDSCIAEGTPIALADGSYKNIEDITFDDNLLVWNFYEGKFDSAKPAYIMEAKTANRYNEVTFEDGRTLKLVGSNGYHRIYNDEAKSFTHTGTETPDGTTTFTDKGEYLAVASQKVIDEDVKYYNIITDKHYNLFANGILTSCRLSNRYDIEDMTYTTEKMSEKECEEYEEKLLYKGFQKRIRG